MPLPSGPAAVARLPLPSTYLRAGFNWPAMALMIAVFAPAPAAQAWQSGPAASDAGRVFERRCAACHSCYNAPCQLDLSAWEGVRRGASSERVYDGTRLIPAASTRLFVDARGADEWHEQHGFFSVVDPLDEELPASSIMARMLALKSSGTTPVDGPGDSWTCPSNALAMTAYELAEYDGMPYGFPPLSPADRDVLMHWLEAGAPAPERRANTPSTVTAAISAWESFLNGESVRERLVARYLYEHLFLAHLHFEGSGRRFYRLVRSATPAGEPVAEIATVRPYDAPGVEPFYYRLRAIESTITHKTHIVFELTGQRLARYRASFLGTPWRAAPTELPPYDTVQPHNPFRTFAAIPARARYRFMLENARYFVMSFIRGPVCEGQMAVNVIDDHFFVLFLDPAQDLSIIDPTFLDMAAPLLELPSVGGSDLFDSYYDQYKARQREFTAFRERRYVDTWPGGQGIEAVWNGDREDRDAWLTVYRHFDNASVVHGGSGGIPKTVWVIDYPIFERIYYLLVAGFNIYGNAFHQAATRLYMDNLRVESEDLFLSFLPAATRPALRAYWYRGEGAGEKMAAENPLRGIERPSPVAYRTDDPKGEWLARVRTHLGGAAGLVDADLNTAAAEKSQSRDARRSVSGWLAQLGSKPHPFVQVLPDVSLLRVTNGEQELVYTLIRNKAHTNVSFMFNESDRRIPEDDTLSIVRGFVGSYPNQIFEVDASQISEFVTLLTGWSGSDEQRLRLFRDFGASRYEPDFWQAYDRISRSFERRKPTESGVLDLSKYGYE